MPMTRAFKSGNSQAVRIPADPAYTDMGMDLEIVRMGDVITIYPACGTLKDDIAILRSMPRPPVSEPVDRTDVPDRTWDL